MGRFNKLYSDFKYGEFSPEFYGRKELEEYNKAAELFNNFIPLREGGFTRRMGSEHVADIGTDLSASGQGPALIPFIVDKKTAYVVVIRTNGNLYATTKWIEIYKNDGTSCTISPVQEVEALPSVDPKGFHYSQIGDVMWVTHSSGTVRPFIITRRDPDTDDFAIVDYTLEISTLINNQNLTKVSTVLKQPYRPVNISTITLTPAAASGSGVNLQASASFFDADMVNTVFKITHGSTTGVCRVTGFTDDQNVTISILINFGATTASTNWQEGSWSKYRGYPRTVVSHNQRNIWGGNKAEPDTVWCSKLGNPFVLMQDRLVQDFGSDASGINYFIDSGIPNEQQTYTPTGVQILASDAFSFVLAAKEANPISWVSSKRNLAFGTLGGEYVVRGELSPLLDFSLVQQTNYGSAPIVPQGQGNSIIFVERSGHALRDYKYNEANGSFVSANLNTTADHIRKVGDNVFVSYDQNYEFLGLAYQASEEIIWALNSSNRLVGLRYSKDNGNVSWFRTSIASAQNIWGACSLPNVDGGEDDLWIVVQRLINSNTEYYLERVGSFFNATSLEESTAIEENLPRFLDSYVKIDNSGGTLTTTVSGLSHLEGESVVFMYRGENLGTYTVSAGQISLTTAAQTKVGTEGIGFVGLSYNSQWISLDPEAGGSLGRSEGHVQRIERVYLRVLNTRYLKCGGVDIETPVKLELTSTNPQELANGIFRHEPKISPGKDQRISILVDEPQPCTLTAVVLRGSTND